MIARDPTRSTTDDPSTDWLKPFATPRRCSAGETVFGQGEEAREMFAIEAGRFRLRRTGYELGAGEIVGELGWLAPDNRRTDTLECVEDGVLLSVGYDDVKRLHAQSADFGFHFLRLVSRRLFQNLHETARLRDEAARHLARLETELDAARKLQMAMVPTVFPAPGPDQPVEVFAMMEPAREVGGDLYDFFTAGDGSFCFLVGDVSGKGAAAALVMARTKTLTRTVTAMISETGTAPDPGAVLARVNRELSAGNDDMMFVTMFFGVLDGTTGELRYCNAGHEPPFRLTAAGLDRIERRPSMALGVMEDAPYETRGVTLAPGEALYVFTDGITEATAADGELFSEARLRAALEARLDAPLDVMVRSVGDEVTRFAGDALPFDDITALAVRLVRRSD